MPAPALRAVPAGDKAALAAESARNGKHISDDARREIMARNWSAVHVTGDRAPAFHWFPQSLRTWRA